MGTSRKIREDDPRQPSIRTGFPWTGIRPPRLASHAPESWPHMLRNAGLPCSGILASHGPEQWLLMKRNIQEAPRRGLLAADRVLSAPAAPALCNRTLRQMVKVRPTRLCSCNFYAPMAARRIGLPRGMFMSRIASFLAVSCLLAAPVFAADTDAQINIVNNSSWDIHKLYISSVDAQEWGPDQLGDDAIASGNSYTLSSIPCDAYDVKIVDEDGDECVVEAVALCADADDWTIEDDALLECQNSE